jgi:hypothetical protein
MSFAPDGTPELGKPRPDRGRGAKPFDPRLVTAAATAAAAAACVEDQQDNDRDCGEREGAEDQPTSTAP